MKKKIRFYKAWLIEITETLCTLCLVLARINRMYHIGLDYNDFLSSHFNVLKGFSAQARRELAEKRKYNNDIWS